MDLSFGSLGDPRSQDAIDGLAAASVEAHRVLDEQWRQLVSAFFGFNWIGGDRQAFNDRYNAIREEVERLRADLAVMPARLADARGERPEIQGAIAFALGPSAGLAWDLLDRVVD